MPGVVASDDTMVLRSGDETGLLSTSISSAPTFQIFSTDDFGTLRATQLPDFTDKVLLKVAPKQANAVQRMARGTLTCGTEVLALARHCGQIDVVNCWDGRKLLTVNIQGMLTDRHRFVGLAVSGDGIFSCTSAGLLTFTQLRSTSSQELSEMDSIVLVLPEPLQCLEFEPPGNPKYFAYGGENIPASVWNIQEALSAQKSHHDEKGTHRSEKGVTKHQTNLFSIGESEQHAEGSNTQDKRKRVSDRRAKARELIPGEIWRAKNLPNDAVSLAVKPSIVSLSWLDESKLAVGTRQGALRLYEVGIQRKAIKEIIPFMPNRDAIKHLVRTHNAGELVAVDIKGRVEILNWRSAKVLYKYEIFAGAALSLCSVPAAQGGRQAAQLITSSSEKLLRLHDMPQNSDQPGKTKKNGRILSTHFYEKGVKNLIWDGVTPTSDSMASDEEDSPRKATQEDDAEIQNDIWQRMATIGDEEHNDTHRSQRRRT